MEDNKNITQSEEVKTEETSQEDKTFTQEDVDRIVKDRLTREKGKQDKNIDEFQEREKELLERELKCEAREILSEYNLPNDFIDYLNYSDKESLDKSIEGIKLAYEKGEEKGSDSSGFEFFQPGASSGTGNSDPIADAFKHPNK